MIIITFSDAAMEDRALGMLPGRFSFKSWESGDMMVPEAALSFLALEGIEFTVKGKANYAQIAPLRSPSAAPL